jgi:alkanesulfonate monooxygenase SsuD/methylene tetrahydromethanopterin reductase-like flavin-dependent oxidoreductase (luciferase family)
MSTPEDVIFGVDAHDGIDDVLQLLRLAQHADRGGLDIVSLSDHPYIGGRLDAYAAVGFILGRTQHISGVVNVTNVPTRPAPMLARTVTSLSALSGGRIVLGMGAGGMWDRISDMGVARLSPGDAVNAFEEAIGVVKMLSGGGPPVSYEGRHYQLDQIEPAPVAAQGRGPGRLVVPVEYDRSHAGRRRAGMAAARSHSHACGGELLHHLPARLASRTGHQNIHRQSPFPFLSCRSTPG